MYLPRSYIFINYIFCYLFQFGLFKIIAHEEALTIVARAMDPSDPSSMLEAVRLLAPICLVPPEGLVLHTFLTLLC